MNANCYKIIFSKRLGTLIAVGEHATSTGKAASGQACHSGAAPDALFSAMAEGFVGVLRLTFASVALACLSLGVTQAQSGSNSLASTALPQGSSVNTGSASISTNGAQMAINQTTDKASINWQSFNVGTGASVNITQPSASSVLLSRVVGNDPSQILGKLSANGQLILLNPNGIVFGKDGSVTASTFTASTFGLSDADFMDGFYKYKRNGSTAAVVNQGTIETSAGGFVALIGATVTNEGTIHAPQGDVMLVAAETVTLPASSGNNSTNSNNTVSVRMSKRVRLELDPAAINTAVHNTESGVIVTEGGQVLLQSAALSTAVASVTHDGSIDTSAPQAGAVAVLADNGVIKVDGSITANSSRNTDGNANRGGNIIIGRDEETGALAKFTDVSGAKLESVKGFVETSGDVLSTTGTRVKADEWLLDPYSITIASGAATSTDYSNYTSSADSTILASDISANLTAGTSVTIATGPGGTSAGNIAVNENIAKTGGGDATLTLQAHGNITLAASKTITSNTGKINVVFNSDSDGAGGGGIVFNSGSGITSNGGNITLGGGTALNGTGYATADGASTIQGISLNTATINAGGGNIAMNGKTAVTNYAGSLSNIDGIYMTGGSITTSGSGTINLSGYNQNTDTQSKGFELASGTITGGSTGAVTIVGDSRGVTSSTFDFLRGNLINGTVTSTGGNISITGYGGSGAQNDYGVDIGGSVIAVGAGAINITGTAGAGGSGANVGVNTSGSGTISSVDGAITITGTGGIGNGAQIRDHGVSIGGTNAIKSTGSGNITLTGTVTNNDNAYSDGVLVGGGGLSTNTGSIKLDGTALVNYQKAVNVKAAVRSTSGNIYIRSAGANVTTTSTGTLSANNISIDNSNGTVDTSTGVITPGTAGASLQTGVGSRGVDISGSITAANNLNVYGNHTGGYTGVSISGATTTVSGKNVTIYGKSNTDNGLLLSGATLSGAYINATGETNTAYTGFAWNGGQIKTTGTTGTSTASVVKGISAASTTSSNGYGALMMFADGSINAATGTTLTLAGEATTLVAGQNIKERGILIQGGRTLTMSGDITFDGSSKSSEGIAFGGTINMATVAGVTNKLTLKGTAAASSNASLNAVNFSGVINGNAATSSINLIGEAKNLSGTNYDTAVNISSTGSITGNGANVNVQALYGKMSLDGAITGANISIDNTGGTIDTSTGVITAGTGTSNYTNAVNINKAVTATGNINVLGRVATTTNTGVNLTATSPITSSGAAATINIASNGNVANAAAISDTASTGTGSNINLTSTSGTITGAGAIGDTTNKNASVTFMQAGTSTYNGAINAANFTKADAGALTLDSWIAPTLVATNVSNAYTVKAGSLIIAPGATYAQLNPASVNVENASTFAISTSANGWWKNTAFNFTGGLGGGIMNLGGNPIAQGSTTNTFSTSGGATNTITGVLNANTADVNFNLTPATSGTTLLDGSFAALAFTQSSTTYGLGSGGAGAGTVNMSGGGNLLIKDKFRATTFNINAGNVQVGDGTAATSSTTATLDATNISIATGSKLTINRAEAYGIASAITGTGSLIQAGAGTLTLTGNSSAFAGSTTVNAGKTLAIGTGGSLGAAGSTLALVDNTSSLVFTEASGTSIVGSIVSGAGSLSHAGLGTGVLTADNTYSGATTVSGGTLQIGNATATGTLGTAGAVTLSNNAALAFNRSANTTLDKAISGNGNVTANITGDLTLASDIALTGSNTINLTASGSITETAGTLAATNLYMTGTTGNIGSVGQRIQSSVDNLALSAAGNAYVTEANAVSIAANVGSLDLATTNGTLNVGAVNGITGVTATTGNVTLSGTANSGNGIYIGNSITASNGTVTLTGTTSSATSANIASPDAGVKSVAAVTAKNINMTASATAVNGGLLGYYGAGNADNFIATEQLNLTGAAAGTGNGFYSYIGTFSAGTGISITGTSHAGQAIGLVNGVTMTNGSTGNIAIAGTSDDANKQGIGLRGITLTNGGGNTVLTAVNGVIATDAGNPAWNTGSHTNTITSNGTGYVHVTAGNGSATNTASIDGSVLSINQNGNAGVVVSTSGIGNVIVPKVINAGTGDIVVAAGTAIEAGTGTGGQVLTLAGNTLTQTNATPGKTYVYSGQASSTGALSNLSTSFAQLYYEGSSHAVNTGFNTAFDSNHADDLTAPSGGSVSNTQVFFRSATKPGFSMTLANTSKIYGDADPTLSATNGSTLTNVYAGANGNNTFAVATADVIAGLTGTRATGEDVGTYAYSLNASSFNTTLTAQPNLVIGQRDITLSALMADHKTYDGTTDALISSATFNTVNSETLGLEGAAVFDTKNTGNGKTVSVADIATLTKSDGTGKWSNYHLTTVGAQTTHADISQAPLTVTATQVSKEYDGLTTASGVGTVGTLAGAGAGDVVNSAGVQVFATKDAGTNNKTVQASDVTIKDTTGSDVTFNYSIQYVNNTTSTISPAPLTIKVNDTAMFVTQDARTALDQGFSYSAFKNGETAATALNGGALTAADRTYTGTSHFPVAGSYNGVYDLATTPTSVNGNYAITVQKGNLTVTPADKLLITIASQSDAYGNRTASNAGHSNSSLVTAQYCLSPTNCNGANLVDLNMTQLTANQWKATDNTGSYVVFDTTVTGTAYSTGGFLKIGNYTFSSTEIAPLSLPNGNFTGRATNGGVLTIHPLAVTLGVNSISKTYDGNTNITGASIAASNAATGDIVNATASTGSYASKDAANGIAVTLSNLSLTGEDAANYYLTTNSVSGTGIITPKNLTASFIATNKVYDGNTQANVTGSSNDIVFNDNVTFAATSANFDNANIGTAKLVSIAGISLGGTDRANYKLLNTTTTATADITAANNSNSSSSSGSSSSGTVTPSKPIIPTDNTNSTESGNGSGGDPSAQNPYLVIPTTKPYVADNCTPTNLEACTCEEQDSDVLPYIAICYQPKKTASTQTSKPRS